MKFLRRLNTAWAIVIAAAMIAAAIFFSAVDKTLDVLTLCGVVATLCIVRSTWRTEWFTGAMERHSDQQRQLAAKRAGVKMIWWDKSVGGPLPFDAKHGDVHEVDAIYLSVPPGHRANPPTKWQRFLRGAWF